MNQITKIFPTLSLEEKDALFSYFPKGLVSLDLETTGLSPFQDKIIEIGAVKIDYREELQAFSQLIDPECPIPPFTTTIHHITDEMVKGRPKIYEILPKFIEFAEELPILAHNASFDMGFIIVNLGKMNAILPNWEIFDSCKLSRKIFRQFPDHKLSTLGEKLKIKNENAHRAYDDALTAFLVFARTLKCAQESKQAPEVIYKQAALFKLSDFRHRVEQKIPENLQSLANLIGKNEIVEIIYQGGTIKNQFRPIRPVAFIPMPKGTVLHAYCMLTGSYKSFSIHKIQSVKLIEPEVQKKWLEELAQKNIPENNAENESDLPVD